MSEGERSGPGQGRPDTTTKATVPHAWTQRLRYRRRVSAGLDVLCGIEREYHVPEDFAAVGLTLGVREREIAGLELYRRRWIP